MSKENWTEKHQIFRASHPFGLLQHEISQTVLVSKHEDALCSVLFTMCYSTGVLGNEENSLSNMQP